MPTSNSKGKNAFPRDAVTSFITNYQSIIQYSATPQNNAQDQQAFEQLKAKGEKLLNFMRKLNSNKSDDITDWDPPKEAADIINGTFDGMPMPQIVGPNSAKMAMGIIKPLLKEFKILAQRLQLFWRNSDLTKMSMAKKVVLLTYFKETSVDNVKKRYLDGFAALQAKYNDELDALEKSITAYQKTLPQNKPIKQADSNATSHSVSVPPSSVKESNEAVQKATPTHGILYETRRMLSLEEIQNITRQLGNKPIVPSKENMPSYFALRASIQKELKAYQAGKSRWLEYTERDEYRRTLAIEKDISRIQSSGLQDSEENDIVIPKVEKYSQPSVIENEARNIKIINTAIAVTTAIKAKKLIDRDDAIVAINAIITVGKIIATEPGYETQAEQEAKNEIAEILARFKKDWPKTRHAYVKPGTTPEAIPDETMLSLAKIARYKEAAKIKRDQEYARLSLMKTSRHTAVPAASLAKALEEHQKHSRIIPAETRYIDHTIQALFHHHYKYLVESNSSSSLRNRLEKIFSEQGYRPVIRENNAVLSTVEERFATIPKMFGKAVKSFGRVFIHIGGTIQPAKETSMILAPSLPSIIFNGIRSLVGGIMRTVGNLFEGIGNFFHGVGKDLAADSGRYSVTLQKKPALSTHAKLQEVFPTVSVNRGLNPASPQASLSQQQIPIVQRVQQVQVQATASNDDHGIQHQATVMDHQPQPSVRGGVRL